jgi:predicted ABC-type ATPase
MQKVFLLIGGPNGCGKSSLYEVLRSRKDALPFFNADLLAVSIEGVQGAQGNIAAGRLLLDKLQRELNEEKSLAVETTMSGRLWLNVLSEVRARGYHLAIAFVTVDTIELSLARIAARKARGGHDIPESTVRRRWGRCHRNFLNLYKPLSDTWFVFDNSGNGARLIAQSTRQGEQVYDQSKMNRIEDHAKASN